MKKEQNPFAIYMKRLQNMQFVPKDPFSHQHTLLQSDMDERDGEEVLSKDAMLGSIIDDQLMMLFSKDIEILSHLSSFADAEPTYFKPFYKKLAMSWLGEVRLTRAKNALERSAQGSPNGGFSMFGGGYGRAEQDEGILGKLNIFKKKGGQQQQGLIGNPEIGGVPQHSGRWE